MLEAGESDYTDEAGYRFERIVQERKSMDEEKLLAELHERNLTSCTVMKLKKRIRELESENSRLEKKIEELTKELNKQKK